MLTDVLKRYGQLGVDVLKKSVAPYSATKKTEQSIRFESTETTLKIFGRQFIETLETGRGPRKSSTQGDFLDNMLDYMKARGIGSGLNDKKRKQLAKFLVLKINKEGDKLYKSGGNRDVYSSTLEKFQDQLIQAVKKDQVKIMKEGIKESLKEVK